MIFKGICRRNKRRMAGFTLIELIVVLALLGIIALIAVPRFMTVQKEAKISVLETNTKFVKEMIYLYAIDYGKSEWYIYSTGKGDWSLNNKVEDEWEIINEGVHTNNSNIVNPYSMKTSILDYNKTLNSGDGYCPALFLTAVPEYAQSGGGETKNIKGTIVAYFKRTGGKNSPTEYIEFYYVNEDGTRSDVITTLE